MATSTTHCIELDLNAACSLYSNSITERINDVVPGLKTSTAFFTFLRANLALQPAGMSSNPSTPLLQPQKLPPPPPPRQGLGSSPLSRRSSSSSRSHSRVSSIASVATSASASSVRVATTQAQLAAAAKLDNIPPLSFDILTTRNDKVDALKLVADSIAQQRQRAALSLIYHPYLLATLAAALAAMHQLVCSRRRVQDRDYGLALTLTAGVIMAYLLAIRYATAGYLQIAEELKWDWLLSSREAPDTEDVVLGTRFGGEMIGALVLRLEPNRAVVVSHTGARRRNKGLRGGRGLIRAWTTKLRYRGKGVGADMLYEAVRITREKCGRDAEVGFAAEHANSRMVLPEGLNRTFRLAEREAAGALEKMIGEFEAGRRKR